MLRAGGQAQSSSDSHVINTAAARRQLKPLSDRKAATPVVVAVLGILGALAFWRTKKRKANARGKGSSPVNRQRRGVDSGAASSSLPRNKLGNNKKNKERKKQERERRAEKRESETGRSGPSDPQHEAEKDNTIILTSKFVDSTPRSVSNLPKAQRMGDPKAGSGGIDPAMAETWSKKS